MRNDEFFVGSVQLGSKFTHPFLLLINILFHII